MLFQEIETEQFFNFFLPELQQNGYDGIFSPKSRARTMTEEDRKYVDGCAIFYRTSKYVLTFHVRVTANLSAIIFVELWYSSAKDVRFLSEYCWFELGLCFLCYFLTGETLGFGKLSKFGVTTLQWDSILSK